MKKFLIAFLSALPAAAPAQKIITPLKMDIRIVTSIDNITPNRANPMASPEISGMFSRMNIRAFFKGPMQKMEYYYPGGQKETTIYNHEKGTSAVLNDLNGERTGYTRTEKQRVDMIVMTDSILNERDNEVYEQSGYHIENRVSGGNVTAVEIIRKKKKVNGISCKKAIVTISYPYGDKTRMEVWYTDEYRLPDGVNNTFGGPIGLSQIDGIPIRYRYVTRQAYYGFERSKTVQYDVKSIDTTRPVYDHEFEIPKSYTVKTWEQYLEDLGVPVPGSAVMNRKE